MNKLRSISAIAILSLFPSLGLAQNIAYRNVVLSSGGYPFPTIRVCTEPATGTPCTSLATIFADPAGTQPLTNPFTGDASGNFTFYGDPTTTYHVQVSGLGIVTYDIPNITLPGGGGGGGGAINQVNGVPLISQLTLNFTNHGNIAWSNPSGGVLEGTVNGNLNILTVTDGLPADTGTTNAYAACPGTPTPTLTPGLQVHFTAGSTNTAGATFNLCTSGPITIVKSGGTGIAAGDIVSGQDVYLQYTSVGNWQIFNPSSVGLTSYTGGSGTPRTGAIAYQATDPGVLGIQQVGTGTLGILKTSAGLMDIGESYPSGNFIHFYPDAAGFGPQILIQDVNSNQIGLGGSYALGTIPTSAGMLLNTTSAAGTALLLNQTDVAFSVSGGAIITLDMNAAGSTFNTSVNFAGTVPFLLNGGAGTAGQCITSDGTKPLWGSCTTASVSTVSGTPGQILSTGGANPVLSIASPFTPPGNVLGAQFGNGNDFLTITRATDVSPSGNAIKLRNAALGTLATLDVLGNWTGVSYTANGTNAGLINLGQGPDNSSNCPANNVCYQAPTSVTAYTVTAAGAGPSALSIREYSALAGAKSTETYVPTTGTGGFIMSALVSAQSAGADVLASFDGSGNLKSSGIASSTVTQTCDSTTVTVATLCGKVDALGLTGNLANTNILAAAVQPGLYVLSVYLNETANPCSVVGSGQFAAKIAYTDSNGAVTRTAGTLTFSTGATAQQPAVISLWVQSATSTINVAGTYTACGTPSGGGAFTLDAHYALMRVE